MSNIIKFPGGGPPPSTEFVAQARTEICSALMGAADENIALHDVALDAMDAAELAVIIKKAADRAAEVSASWNQVCKMWNLL